MAINRSSINSAPITGNYETAIEITTTKPNINTILATQETPGRMVAYYNGTLDRVTLFVVDNSGYRWIQV